MHQYLRAAGMGLTALALAAGLAACGDDSNSPDVTNTPIQNNTPTTTARPGGSVTPTRPVGTATAAPTNSGPSVKRCATADLQLSIASAGAAAGTHFLSLVLTNTSGADCTMTGFPGVSLVDGSGQQLGNPADRNGAVMPDAVSLKPGESAHAVAGFPNYQNFPAGNCNGPSATLKVYPPDELTALVAPVVDYSCPGFSVQVVQPGKNEAGR